MMGAGWEAVIPEKFRTIMPERATNGGIQSVKSVVSPQRRPEMTHPLIQAFLDDLAWATPTRARRRGMCAPVRRTGRRRWRGCSREQRGRGAPYPYGARGTLPVRGRGNVYTFRE